MGQCISMRRLSSDTIKDIGTPLLIVPVVAVGIAIAAGHPIGAAVAGFALAILGLAAALFPEYFKGVGKRFYDSFECFVNMMDKIPSLMRELGKTLKEAWESAWSTICRGVQNLWQWAKGRWSKLISREAAAPDIAAHFQNGSPEQLDELLNAAIVAQEMAKQLVDILKEEKEKKAQQNTPDVTAPADL